MLFFNFLSFLAERLGGFYALECYYVYAAFHFITGYVFGAI